MGIAISKKLFLISLMLFAFLYSKEQNKEAAVSKSTNSAIEERILDTISQLPEYKERALYIEKKTNRKHHLNIIIYRRPSNKTPYYWVKAVEDNGINYYTHFNFYIYANPFSIKYYDTINDKVISLKKWREQTKAKAIKIQ
jgi:hypothetical protein